MDVVDLILFFLFLWVLMAILSTPCLLLSLVVSRLVKKVRLSLRLLCATLLVGIYVLSFILYFDDADFVAERRRWMAIWIVFMLALTNFPLFVDRELGWERIGIVIAVALGLSGFLFLASKPFPV